MPPKPPRMRAAPRALALPKSLPQADTHHTLSHLVHVSHYLGFLSTLHPRQPCYRRLAARYTRHLLSLARKAVVRLHPELKRSLCTSCANVTPQTSTKRNGPHGKVLLKTCACGARKRWPAVRWPVGQCKADADLAVHSHAPTAGPIRPSRPLPHFVPAPSASASASAPAPTPPPSAPKRRFSQRQRRKQSKLAQRALHLEASKQCTTIPRQYRTVATERAAPAHPQTQDGTQSIPASPSTSKPQNAKRQSRKQKRMQRNERLRRRAHLEAQKAAERQRFATHATQTQPQHTQRTETSRIVLPRFLDRTQGSNWEAALAQLHHAVGEAAAARPADAQVQEAAVAAHYLDAAVRVRGGHVVVRLAGAA
ncbi:hypothetical protein ACQY0O_003242 [Thecaphora frezii]